MIKFIAKNNLLYYPFRVLLSLMLIIFKIFLFLVNVLTIRTAFKIK